MDRISPGVGRARGRRGAVFTQERMKLFRRLIARADPGCMSKPRWLSAAVN